MAMGAEPEASAPMAADTDAAESRAPLTLAAAPPAPPQAPSSIGVEESPASGSTGGPEPKVFDDAAPLAGKVDEGVQVAETPGPAPIPLDQPSPVDQQRGTAVYWRVLEGLAAALGLAFLAGLFLRWRGLR